MGLDFLIIGAIYKYPEIAHWIIFFSLILAGFNLPVSEDLMLLTSGILARAYVPENGWLLWAAVFFGAYISDWIAYWTGRLLGPKILTIRWLSKIIHQERLDKMHRFYDKWGMLAFLFGRFIPFGARNCLFLSAGMGHMTFKRFLCVDGVAALVSTTSAFTFAYIFGEQAASLIEFVAAYLSQRSIAFFIGVVLLLITIIGIIIYNRKKRSLRLSELPLKSDN